MAGQCDPVCKGSGRLAGLLENKVNYKVPILSCEETCPGDSFVRGAACDLSGIDFWQTCSCI